MVAEKQDGWNGERTDRRTPEALLLDAIQTGSIKDARLALSRGADQKRSPNPKSFLRLAGEAGHRQLCDLLVEFGADPNEVSGKREYSLLHNAVASGNYGFASTLLRLGADPNARSSSGATPLHFAARSGQGYLVRALLKHAAKPDIRDGNGRTPYDLAVESGHENVADLLTRAGRDSSHFGRDDGHSRTR